MPSGIALRARERRGNYVKDVTGQGDMGTLHLLYSCLPFSILFSPAPLLPFCLSLYLYYPQCLSFPGLFILLLAHGLLKEVPPIERSFSSGDVQG